MSAEDPILSRRSKTQQSILNSRPPYQSVTSTIICLCALVDVFTGGFTYKIRELPIWIKILHQFEYDIFSF